MGQAGVLLVLCAHVGGREAVAFPVDVFPKAQGHHLAAGGHLSTEKLKHSSTLGLYTYQLGGTGAVWSQNRELWGNLNLNLFRY